jgi:DNA-directed RNA polymerase I, II, and III subunit RPABC4
MSREAYSVPSLDTPATANATGTYNPATSGPEGTGPAITYICGNCATKVPLKRGEHIRCKDCGHRVLYKERTKR